MSVTSINTSNGSGITATPSTGDVILNSLSAGLNGIVISGGTGKQALISASDVDFNSMSLDSASGKTVKLIADSTLANNDVYTLPPALPSATGQVLASDTTGTMIWVDSGGGGTSIDNPMTADLDGGGNNIIDVNVFSTTSVVFIETVSNRSINIVSSSNQSDPGISLVLPSAIATLNQSLHINNKVGGDVILTSWEAITGITNPLSSNLDGDGKNLNSVYATNSKDLTTSNIGFKNQSAYKTNLSCSNLQTQNIKLTLPTTYPSTSGQVLTSNTTGAMAWDTTLSGYNLNLPTNLVAQAIGYNKAIKLFTLTAGTYIFNINWNFNNTATFTFSNFLYTGLNTSGTLTTDIKTLISFNSATYLTNDVINSSFVYTLASSSDVYGIFGINTGTGVTTGSGININGYWEKIS